MRMQTEGLGFEEATAPRGLDQTVFTTHTPVPAGHDRFSPAPDRGASRAAARGARDLATTT